MNLEGRVALITGGARRIGRAVALRLADSGCHAAIHYHRSADDAAAVAEECRARGVRADVFQADLGAPDFAKDLIESVHAAFGGLDVLVNNAAIFEQMKLSGFDLPAWERTLRINLTAPMALSHAAADLLRQTRGRIVNLCDASTARPWSDHLAYAVSKGGLETLTKVLARVLAPDVNVVGVAPGVAAWPPEYNQEMRERLLTRVPLGRAGSPEDVASLVQFLLAEGDYITGAIIPVDGGRSLA